MLPESARPKDPELRSNSLGMTETCGPHTIDRMDVGPARGAARAPSDRSVPGVEHKVVDPESGRPRSAPGELGEICVRGYSLMQGLYKVERERGLRRRRLLPHRRRCGRFDADGRLFFKGRLGDMIKTGGANVTPREVEVVLESLPGGEERPRGGGGRTRSAARTWPPPSCSKPGAVPRRRTTCASACAKTALRLQGTAPPLLLREGRASVHRQRQDRQAPTGGADPGAPVAARSCLTNLPARR